MSQLYVRTDPAAPTAPAANTEPPSRWAIMPLEGAHYDASHAIPRLLEHDLSATAPAAAVMLRRSDAGAWTLLWNAKTRVLINGFPIPSGIWTLTHKDEVRTRHHTFFYSSENLAQVVDYPESNDSVTCPVCTRLIPEDGHATSSAVQCPNCTIWHHESSRRSCWSYRDTCIRCSIPTVISANYRWTPEEI